MSAAIWHDVECASYEADLDLWLSLATSTGGPVLDIGCGTGRVALALAGAGCEVTALDADPELVRVLSARARGLNVQGVVADARTFAVGKTFALAIAPMQVVQLLGGAPGRRAMLARAFDHLRPGGLLAVALADPFEAVSAQAAEPPLPDVLERDGWVYSSTPVAVYPDEQATTIERVRSSVSPSGELTEAVATIRLDTVTPEMLYEEGREQGFAARPARTVPPTEDYVGSTVVVLERP